MSKDKAIALLSLLGDNAENVLELLSEDQAQFLRDNKRAKESFNPLELEDVVSSTLESMTRVNVTEPAPSTEDASGDLDLELESASDDLGEPELDGDLFGEEETLEEGLGGESELDGLDLDESESDDLESLEALDSLEGDEVSMGPLSEGDEIVIDEAPHSSDADMVDAPFDYKKIAKVLEDQNPQLVAFFLKKLTQDKRGHIMDFLPETFAGQVDAISVEDLPISDKIFEELYNELFGDWN